MITGWVDIRGKEHYKIAGVTQEILHPRLHHGDICSTRCTSAVCVPGSLTQEGMREIRNQRSTGITLQ